MNVTSLVLSCAAWPVLLVTLRSRKRVLFRAKQSCRRSQLGLCSPPTDPSGPQQTSARHGKCPGSPLQSTCHLQSSERREMPFSRSGHPSIPIPVLPFLLPRAAQQHRADCQVCHRCLSRQRYFPDRFVLGWQFRCFGGNMHMCFLVLAEQDLAKLLHVCSTNWPTYWL